MSGTGQDSRLGARPRTPGARALRRRSPQGGRQHGIQLLSACVLAPVLQGTNVGVGSRCRLDVRLGPRKQRVGQVPKSTRDGHLVTDRGLRPVLRAAVAVAMTAELTLLVGDEQGRGARVVANLDYGHL